MYFNQLKNLTKFEKQKNEITFVGKLNKSKGYDIGCQQNTNKYPNWKANVIGDEQRDKIEFKHKNLLNLGFQQIKKYLKFKNSALLLYAPLGRTFGRTSLEASLLCAVIISNRGGLPETITNGIILKKLNSKNLYKNIEYLIKNKSKRLEL